MRYSVFGRKVIEITRCDSEWQAFFIGNEGKKRNAEGVLIPSSLGKDEIEDYLADLFHEWATISNGEVKKL